MKFILKTFSLLLSCLLPLCLSLADAAAGMEQDLSHPYHAEITWHDLRSTDDASPEGGDTTPGINASMLGRPVKIHGFIVPLENAEDDGLSEFLLVPYFGACIHVPPPPENQIIHVRCKIPIAHARSMDTAWIFGTLRADAHRGQALS